MSTATISTQNVTFSRGAGLASAISSVVFCADNESTRFAMGSVHFKISANGCQVSATDGRRLGINHLSVFDCNHELELLVKASDCKLLCRKLGKTDRMVNVSIENELVTFSFFNSRGHQKILKFRQPVGRFPDVQSIENQCIDENVLTIVGKASDVNEWIESSALTFCVENGSYRRTFCFPAGIQFLRDVSISFNPELLTPWIATIPGKATISFHIGNNGGPIMATADCVGSSTFIFMPLA